jgi:hypothetical protein
MVIMAPSAAAEPAFTSLGQEMAPFKGGALSLVPLRLTYIIHFSLFFLEDFPTPLTFH